MCVRLDVVFCLSMFLIYWERGNEMERKAFGEKWSVERVRNEMINTHCGERCGVRERCLYRMKWRGEDRVGLK